MRRRIIVVIALLLPLVALAMIVLGGRDRSSAPPASVQIRSEVAQLREGRRELARDPGPLTVRALSMQARDGEPMSGYIVRPRRIDRPVPAVVLLHGRGTDASDIVLEGALLAARGAMAVAPDNAYVRLGPVTGDGLDRLRQERRRRLASAADLADIVTALRARDDVDHDRIAVAGYSLGGYVTSLVAPRLPLAAEAYIATGAEWLPERGLADEPAARAIRAQLDPVAAMQRAEYDRRRPRLVQLGRFDRVIRPDRLERFARMVPAPKRIIRYEAGHTLDVQAVSDRVAWLSDRLGLRR